MKHKAVKEKAITFLAILAVCMTGLWGFSSLDNGRSTAAVKKKKIKRSYFERASEQLQEFEPKDEGLLWVTEPLEDEKASDPNKKKKAKIKFKKTKDKS